MVISVIIIPASKHGQMYLGILDHITSGKSGLVSLFGILETAILTPVVTHVTRIVSLMICL